MKIVGSISLLLSLSHLSKFLIFKVQASLYRLVQLCAYDGSDSSASIPIFLQMLSDNAEAAQKKKPIFAI